MISAERLGQLKKIIEEDGIRLSDAAALEVGTWLLERIKSVGVRIPCDKELVFEKMHEEMKPFRVLHKDKEVRHDPVYQ